MVRGESLLWRFAKEFIHFFALILWLAAGLAFFAESQQPSEGMQMLGYAILVMIFINGVFSFGNNSAPNAAPFERIAEVFCETHNRFCAITTSL